MIQRVFSTNIYIRWHENKPDSGELRSKICRKQHYDMSSELAVVRTRTSLRGGPKTLLDIACEYFSCVYMITKPIIAYVTTVASKKPLKPINQELYSSLSDTLYLRVCTGASIETVILSNFSKVLCGVTLEFSD